MSITLKFYYTRNWRKKHYFTLLVIEFDQNNIHHPILAIW